MNFTLKSIVLLFLLWQCLPAFAISKTIQPWDEIYKGGKEAIDQGEYWIAEPLLKQAIAEAKAFNPEDIRLSQAYDELGRLYTIRGRFPEAEANLEEGLYAKEQAMGKESEQFVPACGLLVRFYLTYGTAAKAGPLTEVILSFVQGKLAKPESLNKYKIRLEKGVPLQGWAGAVDPGKRNPALEWAITCDELGNLYRSNGNMELAGRLFNAALDVKSTVLGKTHLSLANSYDNLGTLCLDKQDYTGAETYFAEALDITEKILPPESNEVYARLDKLARCEIKLGKFKEAEALYLRAQNFWKAEPSKYGTEARAAYALGCVYSDQKNYAAAAPLLRKALEMSQQFNGPASINLVAYLRKYAYVLYYLGQREQAEQLKARANLIAGAD
jgi:tetratricopeptide (TPR) repeat protein